MISARMTGAYISELRRHWNLTQADLAGKLMVSPQAISKWETGQTLPDAEQLVALSQLFKVTINEILAGNSRPPESVRQPVAAEAEQVRATESEREPAASGTRPVAPAGSSTAVGVNTIIGLAPFVDGAVLEQMLSQCDLRKLTLPEVIALAPFVSKAILEPCMEHIGEANLDSLVALAPFLRPDRVDSLFRQLPGYDDITFEKLVALAPFVSGDLLAGALGNLRPRSLDELTAIAPFLDSDTVSRLARQLMAGA